MFKGTRSKNDKEGVCSRVEAFLIAPLVPVTILNINSVLDVFNVSCSRLTSTLLMMLFVESLSTCIVHALCHLVTRWIEKKKRMLLYIITQAMASLSASYSHVNWSNLYSAIVMLASFNGMVHVTVLSAGVTDRRL